MIPPSPRPRRALAALGLWLATATVGSPAAAAPPPKPTKARPSSAKPTTPRAPLALDLHLTRFTLENGLRVVIDADRTSPTVAIAVTYDVGSRDEERGRSGFAHLFEHMMFQGSRNVEKGGHFKLISGHGGTLNGTTNVDRTNYYEVLPANELALGLWLEADRMKALDVTQENFENQRKVVQEEYRMRYSNAAYGLSGARLEELVFQGYWPYEHPTIGSMADLDGAKLEWVKAFHAAHYGPDTAVLAIAGDVDPDEAQKLVRQYFAPIPRIRPAPFVEPALPEQTSGRHAVVKDEHARTPSVIYGYATPAGRHPDLYALSMASVILGDGESSRLHQLLVRDKALAQRAHATVAARRGPGLFRVDAVLAEGAATAEVEKLIDGELEALAKRGPSDAEVEKARRLVEAGIVLGLQSSLARARRLGEMELYHGDAGLLAGELGKYLAVTKDDIQRVVGKILAPSRRTVVETMPTEAKKDDKGEKPAGRTP